MKLFKSILTALLTAAVIAVILIGICAAACIAIASIWFVGVLTGIPLYIPLAVIACVAIVLGFILEASSHGKTR